MMMRVWTWIGLDPIPIGIPKMGVGGEREFEKR